jgi:general secretion pathway protein K
MKRRRQSGAALLAAMLTVALVATLAASALWHQWRSVEVEAADRTRVQATWILTGAQDWARLILRSKRGGPDHLGEAWAVPLEESRLSTFLAADKNNNTEASDADNVFLSGEIMDLNARLDVTALAVPSAQPKALAKFQKLFQVLGLPQSELDRLASNLRFAGDLSAENLSGSKAPLVPQRTDELTWLGLAPATVAALEPYVMIVPSNAIGSAARLVNVNTAPAEVIYAVGTNLSLADAQRVVAQRRSQHFTSVADTNTLFSAGASIDAADAGVTSQFFEIVGRLRIQDVVIEEHSIVQRINGNVTTLQRNRGLPAPR